jgi:hypothetical protein
VFFNLSGSWYLLSVMQPEGVFSYLKGFPQWETMLQVVSLSMMISALIYVHFLLRPSMLHDLSISEFLIKPPYYYSVKSTNYGAYQLYKRVASYENLYGGCKWSYNMKILSLTQVVVPVSHIWACVSYSICSVSWVWVSAQTFTNIDWFLCVSH